MNNAPAKHISELIASRRALLGGVIGLPLLNLAGCVSTARAPAGPLRFTSAPATTADTITLAPGYRWRPLIAWGDPLFAGLAPFDADALTRADQEMRFGTNNDMVALFPETPAFPAPRHGDRLILCANNEFFDPALMFPSLSEPGALTPAHIEAGIAAAGVSIVMIERSADGWRALTDAAPGAGVNRRLTPFSPALFTGPAAQHPWIEAAARFVNARESAPPGAVACGTYANCAGGVTPWGTYLSAEENFDYLFGATAPDAPALAEARRDEAFARDCASFSTPRLGAEASRLFPPQFDMSRNPYGPALYGWIVEVDPYNPTAAPRKRTALGRRQSEAATTALTRDGRVAVYSGDDQIDEFVYKFVTGGRFNPGDRAANFDLLDHGQLYAACFEADGTGRWLALTLEAANAAARAAGYSAPFRDEGDLMMRAREAARLLGATPMDRPEDVEALLDENWVGLGPVLIVCTNSAREREARPGNPRREGEGPQANAPGHILRIDEAGGDCGATAFRWDVFALGGDPESAGADANRIGAAAPSFTGARFACPDNLHIDSAYNVWIATDGSEGVFADCNDGVLATSALEGPGRAVRRFLVGPIGAEICGPAMAPDERAFFAAIQHPGQNDIAGVRISELRWRRGQRPPSSFPDGGGAWPHSAIIVVTREDGGRIGD